MPNTSQPPINKRRPTDQDLRRYLKQVLVSWYSTADAIIKVMESRYGRRDEQLIDELPIDVVKHLLSGEEPWGNRIPAYVFEFTTGPEGDLDGRQLYTAITEVSFDAGGLFVLQSFCDQVFTLFNFKGDLVLEECMEISLGMDAQVLYRPLPWDGHWHWVVYDGERLIPRDLSDSGLKNDDFPFIDGRDIIPLKLNDPKDIHIYYPTISARTRQDVVDALSSNEHAFRVLKEHYTNDAELAIHAVRSNKLAFSLIAPALRNNDSFIAELENAVSEFRESRYSRQRPIDILLQQEPDPPDAHTTPDDNGELPF